MESKYNLLTRLLKNIKNVVNPDGSVAGSGGVPVVHMVTEETIAISGTLPDVDGYEWIPPTETKGPFIQIDYDASVFSPVVFIKPTNHINWVLISDIIIGGGKIKIDVSEFGMDGQYPSEDYFAGALIKVVTETSARLDKTYKELVELGFFVTHATDAIYPNDVNLLIPCRFESGVFECNVVLMYLMGKDLLNFVAGTENDYPVLVKGLIHQ